MADADLASPGVQKLILEELERAEEHCALLENYRDRFHDADKHVGGLEEKVKTVIAFDVIVSANLAIGGAIVGLAPSLWADQPKGWLAAGLGVLLMIGAVIARAVKRR